MPSEATDTERRLQASVAAHTSWAMTEDRAARTASAREALENKFLEQAGGDPQRAEHLKKAHFRRLALKSAQARRRANLAAEQLLEAERELEVSGGDAA